MGEAKFKSLPENVRKALVEAGEQAAREGCKRFEDGEKAATEKIKSPGHEGHCLRPRRQESVRRGLRERLAENWVKDIDKRGKPGAEDFQGLHRSAGRGPSTGRSVKQRRCHGAGRPAGRRAVVDLTTVIMGPYATRFSPTTAPT